MSLWHALAGAGRYAAAVASGDIADEEAQRLRIARCRTCPSVRIHKVPLTGWHAMFCGRPPPRDDILTDDPPTCACLVMYATEPVPTDGDKATIRLRVLSVAKPAGKTEVGSQKCPQNKW